MLALSLLVVPSLLHESLVQLLSNCALLVAPLLHGRVQLPEGELLAESLSADLSQLTPTEYRADQVIALRTPSTPAPLSPALVLVVEVQLSVDPHKRRSWPVYVATAAARFDCPVHLLVLAPDPAVARWARGPFGPPSCLTLHPLVLSYDDLPEHLDEALARRFPELAVLTAMAHPSVEIARHAIDLVRSLPSDRCELYCDLIMKALADAFGSSWEASMLVNGHPYEYQSPFARSFFAKGEAEGLRKGEAEGLRKGEAEGLRKGREQALREADEHQRASLRALAIELARGKLGSLPEPLPPVLSSSDAARLSALILDLGKASTPEQALATLALPPP